MSRLSLSVLAVIIVATLGSCVTKRTVSEGGNTISEGYVIKRPVKETIERSSW